MALDDPPKYSDVFLDAQAADHSPVKPQSVVVLGAGVVGLATAYALARRGFAVTVVDAASGPGCGASYANGGQLSYTYTDALASPGLLRQVPKVLLGIDPSISLRPNLDRGYLAWLLRFARNMTADRFRTNTLRGLQLGLESQLAMNALLDRHSLDFGHARSGKLHIYEDPAGFAAARKVVAVKQAAGADQQILGPDEARALEPALCERQGSFVGAVLSPAEETGDPYRFCLAMAELLGSRYGVRFHFNSPIEAIGSDRTESWLATTQGERIEADQLVICAGIGANRFLKGLRLGAVLQPMKGYSLTLQPGSSPPKHSITEVSRKLVFCPLSGKIRIAGLAELGARDTAVKPADISRLIGAFGELFPNAAVLDSAAGGWAGIRPMTANSQPEIRKVNARIAVNIGHGMLGWTYAMGSAERLAKALTGEN
jgi:D-amino-acid dehydrogenase